MNIPLDPLFGLMDDAFIPLGGTPPAELLNE